MALGTIDWIIIIAFFVLTLVVGVYYTKKAGKSTVNFFLGGRTLPWWLAGTSMVATTFAADTPLLITEIVAKNGISGNWIWWNGLIGGMLATFFFAKLWRKAEIITDVELIELRYSGAGAAFLRGFKAIYLGVFMNSVIIAWVNIALGALLQVFFGIPSSELLYYIALAMLVVVLYSSLSGLLGVAVTDFLQFLIAMAGTIVLAVVVVNSEEIGGIAGLKDKLPAETFSFFPRIGTFSPTPAEAGRTLVLGLGTFFAFVGFQWWASWYPGAEPGGGGYIAQRMMSTPKEKDAVKATLLFQIAHYAVRPLPWILVALASLHLYPDLPESDKKLGYVMAMRDFLPEGLRGLLLVAFLSAYMSTVSTQLNWGTSYMINDFYQRFINPHASQKNLVAASRIVTVLMMLISLFVTAQIDTLKDAFNFMITAGAGLGAVLILRWYWWRINAWSEITATLAPIVAYALCKFYLVRFSPEWDKGIDDNPLSFFFIVGFTTVSWLAATFLTKPVNMQTLHNFYLRVSPDGIWKPVTRSMGIQPAPSKIGTLVMAWLCAVVMGYSALFLTGSIVFGAWANAGMYTFILCFSLVSLSYFSRQANMFGDEKPNE